MAPTLLVIVVLTLMWCAWLTGVVFTVRSEVRALVERTDRWQRDAHETATAVARLVATKRKRSSARRAPSEASSTDPEVEDEQDPGKSLAEIRSEFLSVNAPLQDPMVERSTAAERPEDPDSVNSPPSAPTPEAKPGA